MTWSPDAAVELANELRVKTRGAVELRYVSMPSAREPSRWVCSGMPQPVYLGANAAGAAFAAVLAELEAARLPDPDLTESQ
jgi:hypothetical protein